MAKAKILIIEDDRDISGLLGVRLKANGYEPAFAGDAVTALTVARKEQPDLVILDIGLPGGDGVRVMERMKTIPALAFVPVIVVSARDPAMTADRTRAAGARAYLQKPFEMEDVLRAVQDALAEPSGA